MRAASTAHDVIVLPRIQIGEVVHPQRGSKPARKHFQRLATSWARRVFRPTDPGPPSPIRRFSLPLPFPAGSQIQHLDQRREGHGKVDISFVHMLADAFSH
jgi:hypothetical protein